MSSPAPLVINRPAVSIFDADGLLIEPVAQTHRRDQYGRREALNGPLPDDHQLADQNKAGLNDENLALRLPEQSYATGSINGGWVVATT